MNKKEMITEPDYNNGIFRKEQLREPLPAGKYYTGVLCSHFYVYPRNIDGKSNCISHI